MSLKEGTCVDRVYDDAVDVIFGLVDSLLCTGEFEGLNAYLKEDPHDNLALTLAVLTITLAAKDELPNRALYYKKVRDTLGDRADSLLIGLE